MNEKVHDIKQSSEEKGLEEPSSSFLKKAIVANVVIFGFVLIGITLIIRHFNPAQELNLLRTDLHTAKERIKILEEKIDFYESYFVKFNQKLDTLASRPVEQITPEIGESYQTLINEFKILMENEISSPLSIPLLEKGRFLSWLTRHIHIKETPNRQAYTKAYDLLKQGNLLQAIELLRPLAHDPSSSLYQWLEKTVNFHKSLLIKEPS